jgi:hypothetical protein
MITGMDTVMSTKRAFMIRRMPLNSTGARA